MRLHPFLFFVLFLLSAACEPAPQASTEAFPDWTGRPLPPFEWTDLNGDTVRSADLRGKVIFLNGWFTTCAPCLEEMPNLNAIRKLYDGQDIVFLAMALDDAPAVEAFLQKRDFTFRILPAAGDYIQQFGTGFPKNIFIDKKGIIRYTRGAIPNQISKQHPGGKLDDREFYTLIGKLLQEP